MVLLRYIIYASVLLLPCLASANYSLRLFGVGTSHTGADGAPPDDGFYGVHNDGWILIRDTEVPSNWGHNYVGQQTILGGSQNSHPPPYTPFSGVRYQQSYPVYTDNTNQPPDNLIGVPITQPPTASSSGENPDFSGVQYVPTGPVGPVYSPQSPSPVMAAVPSNPSDPQSPPQLVVITPTIDPETQLPSGYSVQDALTGASLVAVAGSDALAPGGSGFVEIPGHGWYNPTTGEYSTTEPGSTPSDPDEPSGTITNDLSQIFPVVVRLESDVSDIRDKLGGAGQSWIRDSKLSLDELKSYASAIGVDLSSVKSTVSSIDSGVASVASGVASVKSSVDSVKSSVDSVKSSVDSVASGVASVKSSVDSVASGVASVNQSVGTLQGITLQVADNVVMQGSSIQSKLDGIDSTLSSDASALRQQLIQQLGAAGNSWVYDCKLSLDELKSMAASLATSENQELIASTVSSSSDSVKDSVDSVKSSVDSLKDSLDNHLGNITADTSYMAEIASSLETIADNTSPDDEGSDIPDAWPVPDFGDYNLPLPVDISHFDTDAASVQSSLDSMIRDGSFNPTSTFSFTTLRDFLKNFVGSIPSVGADPVICSVEMDLPLIGGISRTWSWDDFPGVQAFRAAMVWLVYLFFGLASFKVIHRSLI